MLIRAVEGADARGHDDYVGLAEDVADRLALDRHQVEVVDVDCFPHARETHLTVIIICPQVNPGDGVEVISNG